MLTRRDTLVLSAAAAGASLAGLSPAFAQNVASAQLAQEGPLGDVWLGPKDAKVTIYEYGSLTCSHCAEFHGTTFPELKKRYLDTGQVRFSLREFPTDPRSQAGFMLARADNSSKYYPITSLLFDTQRSWAFVQPDQFKPALSSIVRQAGFSQDKFEAVLRDKTIYDAVNAVKNKGESLRVDSTPTFFINGQRLIGAQPIEAFEKIIKPLLGA